jgi:hypothetical protein
MTRPDIYWNPDTSRGVLTEFINETIQFYYYWKSDNLEQQVYHKLCHVPCFDLANQIARANREGRRYVYWLSSDYFMVASSINPVSYNSVFDLYYWPVDDKIVLGPRFIFFVPAESKSNHLRLCLVPELCRMEFINDWSIHINPVSGELEYTEIRKTQLIAGYDDKLSSHSYLGSRGFQWRIIDIPHALQEFKS